MSTFLPRGDCLLWQPELIWLNVVSDAMLACAFVIIAFVLWLFAWRRHHEIIVAFRVIFWTFGAFAILCAAALMLRTVPAPSMVMSPSLVLS